MRQRDASFRARDWVIRLVEEMYDDGSGGSCCVEVDVGVGDAGDVADNDPESYAHVVEQADASKSKSLGVYLRDLLLTREADVEACQDLYLLILIIGVLVMVGLVVPVAGLDYLRYYYK